MEYANRGNYRARAAHTITNFQRFKAFYGCSAGACAFVWRILFPHLEQELYGGGARYYHLLWALMFVKLYNPVRTSASIVSVDEKTYNKWVWIVLKNISMYVKPRVISLGMRFENNKGAAALLSVDGIDCPANMKLSRRFYSHKFRGVY